MDSIVSLEVPQNFVWVEGCVRANLVIDFGYSLSFCTPGSKFQKQNTHMNVHFYSFLKNHYLKHDELFYVF